MSTCSIPTNSLRNPRLLCLPEKPSILLLSGPAGAGKDTLWHCVSKKLACLPRPITSRRSVSHTTRTPRMRRRNDPRGVGFEEPGTDYFFSSSTEFLLMIDANRFAEYALVHGSNYYGTSWEQLDSHRGEGLVWVEINYEGVDRLAPALEKAGRDYATVFIQPPGSDTEIAVSTRQTLERLGTDSADAIRRRVASVEAELKAASSYDRRYINDPSAGDMGETVAMQLLADIFNITL